MGSGFAGIVSAALYEQMFPNRNALYSYEAIVAAADSFPAFCNEGSMDDRKREAAAFLANISHETTGGWAAAPGGPESWGLYFIQEVGCEMGACTWYCDNSNVKHPCAPGKTYHGRGPIQLSWNYNYGFAGEALGLPLLTNPDLVTSDGTVAFKTGVWFWTTPQAPKPSCHDVMTGKWTPSGADMAAGRVPGFGMTINIINGGLECSMPTNAKVEDRVKFYQRYTQLIGVDPGPNLYCDQMAHY
jgi:basic endochitinase B